MEAGTMTTTPFEDLRIWLTSNVFYNDQTVFLTPYQIIATKDGKTEPWVKRCEHFVPLCCSEIEWFDNLPEDTDFCKVKSVNNAEDDYYIFNIIELKNALSRCMPCAVCCTGPSTIGE